MVHGSLTAHGGWLALVLVTACGNAPGPEPTMGPVGEQAELQDADQIAVDTHAEAGTGTALLMRYDDRVAVSGAVDAIDDTHAYTLWWAIFNDPSKCEGIGNASQQRCDSGLESGADFAGVQVDRTRAAFGLCGALTLSADRHEFECERAAIDGLFEADADGEGALGGLDEPLNAEIHIIVRSHGPALTGDQGAEQQTLYNGGCGAGDDNEGMCADVMYFPFAGAECVVMHGVRCP